MLAALLVCALAGCGGDGGDSDDPVSRVPAEGGLQERVRAASQVDTSSFPSAEGKTLNQLAEEIRGGGSTEVGLATSVFTVGSQRLAFGMIDDQGQFVYGPSVVYVAPTPDDQARGPFAAPADVLVTEGRYRSRQAAEEGDPFAAVYQSQVRFGRPGDVGGARRHADRQHLRGGARARAGDDQEGRTRSRTSARPRPRSRPTRSASVKGDEELLDTRVPPSDMHEQSFDQVVGKKPVALLFATPQLCQSRVCGPVTDIALQMKAKYGDKVEFIHQEVYEDNDPQQGLRRPLQDVPAAHRAMAVRGGRRRARSPPGSRARSASGRSTMRCRPLCRTAGLAAVAVLAAPATASAHGGPIQRNPLPIRAVAVRLGGGGGARRLLRRARAAVAEAAAGAARVAAAAVRARAAAREPRRRGPVRGDRRRAAGDRDRRPATSAPTRRPTTSRRRS